MELNEIIFTAVKPGEISWILTLIILTPLVGVGLLIMPPRGTDASVRRTAFAISLLTLVLTVVAVYRFQVVSHRPNHDASQFLLRQEVSWVTGEPTGERDEQGRDVTTIDIAYRVGVDGISLWLIALTSLLLPLSIWSSFTSVRKRVREYYCLLLLLEAGLLGVFCAMDLLLFFVFFEFTLIPLYFLIGVWGGPERRRAAGKFFLYTIAGSVLTFAGIIYLAYYSHATLGRITLNISELIELGQQGQLPVSVQCWLFAAFAAGFAIKVPLFPVHTWLPLAHTEAPTAGSVILAGVLLKLGTYGFCRLSIPMLPDAAMQFAPLLAVLSVIGILYAALAAWVQTDVKKLVAYSSVSHLGFCMLGLFSLKMTGVNGGVLYMINHGLSTGALFLLIGFVYERYHTREMGDLGGLARPMPWLAIFLVFFTLSSIGLPGLNGFIGEFMVLVGTATSDRLGDGLPAGPLGFVYAVPAAGGIILGAVYMLWMCQRVLFGPLREPPHTPDVSAGLPRDLSGREIAIVTPLALACLFIGVYPKPMLRSFETAVRHHVFPATEFMRVAGVGAQAGNESDEITDGTKEESGDVD